MKFLIAALSLLFSTAAFAQIGHIGDIVEWPGSGWGGTQRVVINCSSQDHGTRVCPVGGEVLDVRLIRQLSNAPCIEGRTFYSHRETVIVSNGCRGDFEVTIQQDSFGHNGTIYCASEDYRFNSCRVGYRVRDVYLERQESNSPCREGQTWGWDRDRIWVDKGCRAYFRIVR